MLMAPRAAWAAWAAWICKEVGLQPDLQGPEKPRSGGAFLWVRINSQLDVATLRRYFATNMALLDVDSGVTGELPAATGQPVQSHSS